jgi:hypothetical protein
MSPGDFRAVDRDDARYTPGNPFDQLGRLLRLHVARYPDTAAGDLEFDLFGPEPKIASAELTLKLLPDVTVGADEHANEVSSTNDPDELPVAHDGESVDVSLDHEPGGLGDRSIRCDRHSRRGHGYTNGRRRQATVVNCGRRPEASDQSHASARCLHDDVRLAPLLVLIVAPARLEVLNRGQVRDESILSGAWRRAIGATPERACGELRTQAAGVPFAREQL